MDDDKAQVEWTWTLEDDVVAALNALPPDACVGDQAISATEVFIQFLRHEATVDVANRDVLNALAKRLEL